MPPASTTPLQSAGCPRCGYRFVETYKYCPSCSYRLRPDLKDAPAQTKERPTVGMRLLSLGGYLAFASLLLLVTLAGLELFLEQDRPAKGTARTLKTPRDQDRIALSAASFRRVGAGSAFWGLFDPGDEEARINSFAVDDRFRLCVHEVTNDQYYAFLLARARKSERPVEAWFYPRYWTRATGNPLVRRMYDRGRANYPVRDIRFAAGALEFCAWLWVDQFGADPDIVVDLPTELEYVLAARGDRVDHNFPWGWSLLDVPRRQVVLSRGPRPVMGETVEEDGVTIPAYVHDGFYHLIGNVSEWVHDDAKSSAAGWSFENLDRWRDWKKGTPNTPFSDDGFERGVGRGHGVGFRVCLRRAPEVPQWERVEPGAVHHVAWQNPLLPPEDLTREPIPSVQEILGPPRFDPVTFPNRSRAVPRRFHIARTAITNRQYQAFLVAVAQKKTAAEMRALLPGGPRRRHPLAFKDHAAVFSGHYGPAAKIPYVYLAGRGNHPVQGVTIEQADAYALWLSRRLGKTCRIPTVAEYLRAGRGDRRGPYPWGADPGRQELICTGRAVDEGRPVSLLGRLGAQAPRIVGLVGNLAEFVRDEVDGRLLLAGGCYRFPAAACTLDCFLDAGWDYVTWQVPEEIAEETGAQSGNRQLAYLRGFRLVKVEEL